MNRENYLFYGMTAIGALVLIFMITGLHTLALGLFAALVLFIILLVIHRVIIITIKHFKR